MKSIAVAMASVLAIGIAAARAESQQDAIPQTAAAAAEGNTYRWLHGERKYNEVLKLVPNLEHGKEIYEACAACHLPEGWGRSDGTFPEIAGQHRTVLIKQLIDMREGNRANRATHPFALPSEIGSEQSLADVTGYVSSLPMSPENGCGPGTNLAHGKKLYADNCAQCHGETGAGDPVKYYPRIQGQHFEYLRRQFKQIKEGKRRNANLDMVNKIESFSSQDTLDVLDFVSRLQPPQEIVAAKG